MPLPSNYVSNRAIVTQGGRVRILPSAVIHETFIDPATSDTDGISASHAGAGSAGTTNMTIGGALASGGVASLVPARNVIITVTHASAVVAMSGTITGTDRRGNVITEAWSVTATGTSKTFTGKKAFATITSITEVVAADASANTIIAGTGKVFGLQAPVSAPAPIGEAEDGAKPGTAGTLAIASDTGDTYGTYSPNTAPNGTHDYDIWYLSDSPEMAGA